MAELDTLRAAYGDADSGVDSMHLSDERWEQLACGELSDEDHHIAIDHILACSLCTDTYKALRILASEARDFDPAVPIHDEDPSKKSPSRKNLWRGLGLLSLAAAATMAVVLPTFLPRPPVPDNGVQVLRSAGSETPARPVFPVDHTVVLEPGADFTLRWTGADPAPPAVVEILDGEGEVIWTSPETRSTAIDWPEDVAATPGRYYWRVVVTGAGDKKISSPLVSFDLTTSRP